MEGSCDHASAMFLYSEFDKALLLDKLPRPLGYKIYNVGECRHCGFVRVVRQVVGQLKRENADWVSRDAALSGEEPTVSERRSLTTGWIDARFGDGGDG